MTTLLIGQISVLFLKSNYCFFVKNGGKYLAVYSILLQEHHVLYVCSQERISVITTDWEVLKVQSRPREHCRNIVIIDIISVMMWCINTCIGAHRKSHECCVYFKNTKSEIWVEMLCKKKRLLKGCFDTGGKKKKNNYLSQRCFCSLLIMNRHITFNTVASAQTREQHVSFNQQRTLSWNRLGSGAIKVEDKLQMEWSIIQSRVSPVSASDGHLLD